MIPGFKLIRRLIVTVVVLGGLFVGANLVAENIAEDKLGEAVANEFDLSVAPTIDLGGFPVIVNVLRGELPKLSLDAADIVIEGLRVKKVHIELTDLRVPGGLLAGIPDRINVGEASGVAEVGDAAITAYLRAQKQDAIVRFREGGASVRVKRRFAGRQRTLVARGVVVLRNDLLIFRPRSVTVDGRPPPQGTVGRARKEATVSVHIPPLPGGLKITSLQAHPGVLRLVAAISDTSVEFGGKAG